MKRWDQAWVTPAGSAPERDPGEPGFGLLAAVHLAVFFGLGSLGSVVAAVVQSSGKGAGLVAALAVMWLGLVAGGGWTMRRRTPLSAWVADLLLASAAVYLGSAVGLSAQLLDASDAQAMFFACVVALPYLLACYVLHRRLWLQIGTVGAAAGALLSALTMGGDVPDPVYGAYLLILAGFLVAGAMSGLARPVRSAAVLAAVLATAGCQVLIGADALGGSTVTVLVLAGVVAAVVRTGNRSLLPVVLVSGVVLLPQLLAPGIGTAHAIGLSLSGTAAVVAWLAVDLTRRSPRPRQVGGVMAACLALLLVAQVVPVAAGRSGIAALLDTVAVAAFFAAAAAGRRRPATVISGLMLVESLPRAVTFEGSPAVQAVVGLLALGGAVFVAVRLDQRAPRPAASFFGQEQALTGPGSDWTVPVPYQQAFDAVVAELASAGLVLQLVDRAAGRVVAGDVVHPWLTVALWATDPVQCHVRAVGAPGNVERLREQLGNRLAVPH
jgi:hypothetical protein